jgi:ParB family chromosome partitioning protein
MWSLHDRLDEYITADTCAAEIQSFSKHGQLVPVLGRRVQGDPDFDVELIYGARRLFVARHLNKELLVELRAVSEREGMIAVDIENRQRRDISPYERGLCFTRWLRGGHCKTQEDLARMLKVSASQVSRLVKLARLPSVVVNAFGGPLGICEGWGLELVEAWDDAGKREYVAQKARSIAASVPRPPPQEVYEELRAASLRVRLPKTTNRDEVVTGESGTPLFRIRRQRNAVALVIPSEKLSRALLNDIRAVLVGLLQRASSQIPELKGEARGTRRRPSGSRNQEKIVESPQALLRMDDAVNGSM